MEKYAFDCLPKLFYIILTFRSCGALLTYCYLLIQWLAKCQPAPLIAIVLNARLRLVSPKSLRHTQLTVRTVLFRSVSATDERIPTTERIFKRRQPNVPVVGTDSGIESFFQYVLRSDAKSVSSSGNFSAYIDM